MSTPRQGESTGLAPLVKGVVVLSLVILALTGITRACSFSPTTPDVDRSRVTRVDVPTRMAAAGVDFALRTPALPTDWIGQSFDVHPVGPGGTADPATTGAATPRAVRVGWVTPDDHFLRLVQSPAPEADLVASEQGDPAARGAVGAGGTTWVEHTGVRGEAMWVADAGGVRLLVTGDAPAGEFTTLATAALAAPAR